jgi:hypothetical protein
VYHSGNRQASPWRSVLRISPQLPFVYCALSFSDEHRSHRSLPAVPPAHEAGSHDSGIGGSVASPARVLLPALQTRRHAGRSSLTLIHRGRSRRRPRQEQGEAPAKAPARLKEKAPRRGSHGGFLVWSAVERLHPNPIIVSAAMRKLYKARTCCISANRASRMGQGLEPHQLELGNRGS